MWHFDLCFRHFRRTNVTFRNWPDCHKDNVIPRRNWRLCCSCGNGFPDFGMVAKWSRRREDLEKTGEIVQSSWTCLSYNLSLLRICCIWYTSQTVHSSSKEEHEGRSRSRNIHDPPRHSPCWFRGVSLFISWSIRSSGTQSVLWVTVTNHIILLQRPAMTQTKLQPQLWTRS